MLMGLGDVLRMVQDPAEREAIKADFLKHMEAKRKLYPPIDLSDMPEIKDGSRFVRGKPYIDKMREHNLKIEAERNQAALTK